MIHRPKYSYVSTIDDLPNGQRRFVTRNSWGYVWSCNVPSPKAGGPPLTPDWYICQYGLMQPNGTVYSVPGGLCVIDVQRV